MRPTKLLNEEGILHLISAGKPIEIVFPVMNASIQDCIHFIVNAIARQYHRPDLVDCIYTTLKELVMNGIKANIKHSLFVEHKINPNNEESLQKGLDLLKDTLNEKNMDELEQKAIKKKLMVRVNILHSRERIILIVENNTVLSELEDQRIRKKFEAALNYDSIADYYMDNMDDSEGQGIGITMIIMMLKGNQIDPHAFTFDMKARNLTRAKIEFPLAEPPVILRNIK